MGIWPGLGPKNWAGMGTDSKPNTRGLTKEALIRCSEEHVRVAGPIWRYAMLLRSVRVPGGRNHMHNGI